MLLICAMLLSSCGTASTAAAAQESAAQEVVEAPAQENAEQDAAEVTAQENAEQDAAENSAQENTASETSAESAAADESLRDLYAMETYDTVPEDLLEWHDDVDYGTIDEDVEYYSATAGDNKYCNVLLPAGYDESQEYPVLYMIHGWGGSYDSHVYDGSDLQILYGNMLSEGLTVPMIIVGVDMYTDPLADKDSKSEEEMRLSYDKTVDDIGLDLMPFIEENYSVKTGRLNTAVTGVSQGATTSLATGFKWQSKIAYIASLAPDPGVIPTPYYAGTYWNWPIFDDFTIESPETMPRYIYLTVGTEDPWNIDVTAYYGEVMDKNGIPNQNDLVEGYGHDGDFWSLGHYNFLQKIFLDQGSVPGQEDNGEAKTEREEAESMLQMTIGETFVDVEWEDNGSVEALKELCQEGPLTIRMSMYGGFEQVGSIGQSLPRDDNQTTTQAGDIVLYSGDQIVVFYGSNSWAYTRLGHITDKTAQEMAELLGNGEVTITIEME